MPTISTDKYREKNTKFAASSRRHFACVLSSPSAFHRGDPRTTTNSNAAIRWLAKNFATLTKPLSDKSLASTFGFGHVMLISHDSSFEVRCSAFPMVEF